MQHVTIRTITVADNATITKVIRTTHEEYGATRPVTVYFDETTDHLSQLFTLPGSIYFIAEQKGIVLGGAGIYPTDALPQATCELVKMYLQSIARVTGLGKQVMVSCINFALSKRLITCIPVNILHSFVHISGKNPLVGPEPSVPQSKQKSPCKSITCEGFCFLG